ncbi:MAG: hypothetical protein ACU85U_19310 [Gammaproteobacteria bacterium]
MGRDDAQALAENATKLIVAKGKTVTTFTTKGGVSDEAVDAMLGPTGNLRAPTFVSGKTIVVGFNEDEYANVLA